MSIELTRAGRVISLILGTLILLSLSSVINDAILTYASRNWMPATAHIISVESNSQQPLRKDKDGILYQYSVGGISYTNSRINYSRRWKWSVNEWKQWMKTLDGKETIQVYYDPQKPQQSVIVRGGDNRWNIGFVILQLLFVVLFAWIALMPKIVK